jgi:hypothetical protein
MDMIARLAGLIALAMLPLAVAAQPAPDPAALDLARLIMARDQSLYDDADPVRMQQRVERMLLDTSGACDPFNAECQAAAIPVAREFMPRYRQAEHERAERVTALLLADSLRPEEMARVAAFLRSPEGGHFLDAWALLRDSDRSARRRRELDRQLAATTPDVLGPARTQFRERTRNLPRPGQRPH